MTAIAFLRRIAVIGLWIVGAFWGWLLLIYFGLRLLLYLQLRYHWPPLINWFPEWIFWAFTFGGTFAVSVAALLLGMVGKLPGTSRGSRAMRGFPIGPAAIANPPDGERLMRKGD